MEDNKVLKLVYTFFLGILLAVFVGVGVDTFYTAPEMPEYPVAAEASGKEPNPLQIAAERDYERRYNEAYETKMKPYSRNVSLITLTAAVLFVVISLVFGQRIKIIADGVMLGGLFTLLYSIGRSFEADDKKYTFVVVCVGLLVVMYLGYHRFMRQQKLSA